MIWSPWLGALLVLLAVTLLLSAQIPLRTSFDVGLEEGYGSDLPMLDGFYPVEPYEQGGSINWRWSTAEASVRLPGSGSRPLLIELRIHSVSEDVYRNGARSFAVWSQGRLIGTFPVIAQGGTYTFVLPAGQTLSDQQGFQLRSAVFSPPGDSRELGLPVDRVLYELQAGPALPPAASTLGWLLAGLLGWLGLRASGLRERVSFVLLLPAVALLACATVLDPPRAAFGWWPAVQALALGVMLVLMLRWALRPLARTLEIPLDDRALTWLLALAFAAFALRYGGKLYPHAMAGDIGFHTNRFLEVVEGRVLLLSRNRGVDFPYPPALYLLLAPLTLLQLEPRNLLWLAGAVFDALSIVLVYTIGLGVYRAFPVRSRAQVSSAEQGWAVAAAALYSFSAATFMTTWWNFSTHIFAQFTHLLLIAALIVLVPRILAARSLSRRSFAGAIALGLIASLVFLGHFGFWINVSLLICVGLLVLLAAAWRGAVGWRVFWLLTLAAALAELVAIAGFYSGYTGMFLEQAQAAQAGGLTGVAGREPIPDDVLWNALWNAGFRVHFGFFPVPLAAIGLVMWFASTAQRQPDGQTTSPALLRGTALTLAAGTLLIALGFAALPFISGSSLSTRWLMFSAWFIAVAAIAVVRASWHWGRLAHLVYGLMAGYVLWVSASQWLGALAWRIRPPEPFYCGCCIFFVSVFGALRQKPKQ
ncbi:MAG: hypothetical protein H7Z42_14540 [Roseiflexaceae bacterium]|nr:hypothetical protein [Roseiflexaceae bacterium]